MKKFISALSLVMLLISVQACKNKDEPQPQPQPEPVKYGAINFKVTTYDSLGNIEASSAGVKVTLVENKLSAITDSAGLASFSNLAYGLHTPVLQKTGYDGPMLTVDLKNAAQSVHLPFPKHSYYQVSNMNAQDFNANTVYFSFNLFPDLAPDDSVKVAVIGSSTSDLTHRKFESVDLITVAKTKTTDYNIALLPSFKNMLTKIDSAAFVYVSAVPVSYGLYESNLQTNPQLLGRVELFPGSTTFVKSWKN